jgi:N-acylneuraminate cytidylyltransferase/CMP-N,N'-diacetyllegionaminic acid synthase
VFAGRRVLTLIPARGGSKGLPRKNVAPLRGRPLIAWTIAAAAGSDHVDSVVVTTDDDEIAQAALAAGARVPFRRPAALATDEARMTDVVSHALDTLAAAGEVYGWLLLLQPTSPLRTAAHIEAAFARLDACRGSAIVSVCEAEHSPQWMGELPPDGNMGSFGEGAATRANRQELTRCYRLNGAVYLAAVEYWRAQAGFLGPATFAYVMARDESVDVDSPLDLEIAELLLARRDDAV